MEIHSAQFIKSSPSVQEIPAAEYPEYAFVGRSNVGKSSLINRICNRKKLAHTSSTPGKTRLINHFLINEAWYLVDLPGFGYAKVSKKERAIFTDMVCAYVEQRTTLVNTFVLVDARIPPQAIDLEFIEFLGIRQLPFTILFTKTDKPNQSEISKTLKAYRSELLKIWDTLPNMIMTSAVKGSGRNKILKTIDEMNEVFFQATT